jgi:hypothetical protein
MTSFDATTLIQYRNIVQAATPGPWLDGNWFSFCSKKHVHNFSRTGNNQCEPGHVFSGGGRLVSAGTELDPGTIIGHHEFDGVTISEANKRFIVFFNPAVVNEMLDAIEAQAKLPLLGDAAQQERSRQVKSLLKKVICKDGTELTAIDEASQYIAELEQTIRTLTAQLPRAHD